MRSSQAIHSGGSSNPVRQRIELRLCLAEFSTRRRTAKSLRRKRADYLFQVGEIAENHGVARESPLSRWIVKALIATPV